MAFSLSKGLFRKKTENKIEGAPTTLKSWRNIANHPSADIAALIDAIRREGRANRKEELREDRGKQLREIVTIVLLFLTLIAVFRQVQEMVKVYGPIKTQAEAAQTQAKAANLQAEDLKDQTMAAKDAAKASHESLVAAQRAWVGPYQATIDAVPTPGNAAALTIFYQNTGRQPATGMVQSAHVFVNTLDEDKAGVINGKIFQNLNECLKMVPFQGSQVVYPSTGFSANQMTVAIDRTQIDDQVAKGTKFISVMGCFAYETFGAPHHSAFCFFTTLVKRTALILISARKAITLTKSATEKSKHGAAAFA